MRRLLGWTPRTRSWTEGGITWSEAEPELDWLDVTLLKQWAEFQEDLCPLCGRPEEMHKGVTLDDVSAGYRECVFTLRKVRAQTKMRLEQDAKRMDASKTSKDSVEAHWVPESALTWTTLLANEVTDEIG